MSWCKDGRIQMLDSPGINAVWRKKRTHRGQIYLIIALLALMTLSIYWQVAEFQFVNFDDDVCVQNNPMVLAGCSPAAVRYAFTHPYEANYIPLVWLSYMIEHDFGDYVLDSNSPGLYHLTNVALHLANTVLLFLVLLSLTGAMWRSAFVAALFAVHPLHVESVAWVTERKDVLSALFWMLTLLAYIRYARREDSRSYGLVILAFVAGLLSKSMLVTLPITLLLLDYWPLKRYGKDGPVSLSAVWKFVAEKFSMWVLVIAGCAATIWAQRSGGAVASFEHYTPGVRLANATVAYIAYIIKMFYPTNLSFLYPHPGATLPLWQIIGSGALLIAACWWAVQARHSRPYITVGWFWYMITLLPVIGIMQVGKQAMADRYTYIPLIGLFIIIAWGVTDLLKLESAGRLRKALTGAASITALLVLSVLAYAQIGTWENSYKLCEQAIRSNYNNPLAHMNLGSAYQNDGKIDEAIEHFKIAVKMQPNYVDAHFNLGTAFASQDKSDEAITEFAKTLQIAPNYYKAHNAWGVVLAKRGEIDGAIKHFRAALKINKYDQDSENNLRQALEVKSQME